MCWFTNVGLNDIGFGFDAVDCREKKQINDVEVVMIKLVAVLSYYRQPKLKIPCIYYNMLSMVKHSYHL